MLPRHALRQLSRAARTSPTSPPLLPSLERTRILPLFNVRSISSTHPGRSGGSNPQMSFPCLDALEARTQSLQSRALASSTNLSSYTGPEPTYTTGSHQAFTSTSPLLLDYGGVLPKFTIAYETWGTLNPEKSNAILLHTGLSASSHAHSNEANPKPGWWEQFIGPGKPVDTDRFFVICTNVLGGCYGSTGPSSIDPSDGFPYATRFPILTLQDMVRGQFRLLDHLGITKLYASVGSSMGGMLSLCSGTLYPSRVGRIVSISGCARSHPYSIAMRHTQRQVLMADPAWNRGFYYSFPQVPPHTGMKLARQIATITYRSGPEWEQRFGRQRADGSKAPALCPDFLIETYLDHAGEKWCLEYDANSLLYVSKAMDLFDLGAKNAADIDAIRARNQWKVDPTLPRPAEDARSTPEGQDTCSLTLPPKPYKEQPRAPSVAAAQKTTFTAPPEDLVKGLSVLANHPTLILGVATDILFPAWQQREIAETLRAGGNRMVTHVELGEDKSLFGHDTFLLDLVNVGGTVKRFLE
ncbi:homoserine O-acetyltransferase [Tirmania nivea]|nr:homoserine O-acetyltransferase [Tirmania nivea]